MAYLFLFMIVAGALAVRLHFDRFRRDLAWARKMERRVAKLRYEQYKANRPYGSAKYLEDM